MKGDNLIKFLDKYFSFVMFAIIFLLGLMFIFLTKDGIIPGIMFCVLSLLASLNNYLKLRKNKI